MKKFIPEYLMFYLLIVSLYGFLGQLSIIEFSLDIFLGLFVVGCLAAYLFYLFGDIFDLEVHEQDYCLYDEPELLELQQLSHLFEELGMQEIADYFSRGLNQKVKEQNRLGSTRYNDSSYDDDDGDVLA